MLPFIYFSCIFLRFDKIYFLFVECVKENCAICLSNGYCASCGHGYQLDGTDGCEPNCSVENCDACNVDGECNTCTNGFTQQEGACTPTCNVQNCDQCDTDGLCSICNGDYTLSDGGCQRTCSDVNCQLCNDNGVCEQCPDTFYITAEHTCRGNIFIHRLEIVSQDIQTTLDTTTTKGDGYDKGYTRKH